MTLSFSKKWKDGTPTYFVDKIWEGIIDHKKVTPRHTTVKSKIHTIREDKKKRWKVGNKIHFVINNRTPKRFQFAPVLLVKSIQEIEIKWHNTILSIAPIVWINGKVFFDGTNFGEYRNEKGMLILAQNDGFLDVQSFFNWFNEDFAGKIIHWTDQKY